MRTRKLLLSLVVVLVLSAGAFAQNGIGNSEQTQGQGQEQSNQQAQEANSASNSNAQQNQGQGQEQGQNQGQEANSASNSASDQTQNQGQEMNQAQNNEGVGNSRVQSDISGQVSSDIDSDISNRTSNEVGNEVDNKNSLTYAPTSISKYSERTGVITAGHPNPPWAYPFNPEFWNDINQDPVTLQRWWVPGNTRPALKRIRNKGFLGLRGDGFRYEVILDDYSPRPKNKSAKIFSITENMNMRVLFENYEDIGVIVVMGDVRRHFDQIARKAIDIGFKYDINAVYLGGAINPVNKGNTMSGPGLGGASAGANYSLSVIGGALSTKSKVIGEGFVYLRCYRKIPEWKKASFLKYTAPANIAAAFVTNGDGNGNGLKPKPTTPTPPILESISEGDVPVGPALSNSGNVSSILGGLIGTSDEGEESEEESVAVEAVIEVMPVEEKIVKAKSIVTKPIKEKAIAAKPMVNASSVLAQIIGM